MTQESDIPKPEPRTQEDLDARVKRMLELARVLERARVMPNISKAEVRTCNESLVGFVLTITDMDAFYKGNPAANLPKIMPQLVVNGAWDTRLDFIGGKDASGKPTGDGYHEEDELSAALLAAVEVAAKNNIALKDVSVDDIVPLLMEKCQQIQKGGGVCT